MKPIAKVLAGTLFATLLASAVQAQTLVYCSEGSPEGFDPALYSAGTTFDASSRTVYNRLVEFKHGSTELEPGLATSWKVSDDGTVYTFKLRPNVKFQTTDFFTPTRDFNADDVIFSFERQLDPKNPWHNYVSGAQYTYADSMGFPDLIKSIEKVDDMTVKFTLAHPSAPFLADLGMDFSSIVSKEYAEKLKADGKMVQMNQKPLGTGPFEFVAYQPDAVIR
ncbi:MAG TPA: ABC transporter substrate-binding protein, partial [Pararhizobium sp.]|nr:ABC transporter substrate-binding protein [Pararhizobium sp.]